MQVFKNVDEFLKQSNLDKFKEHEKCFEHVVNNLDYATCKEILLGYIDINELRKAYNKDKYLNNIGKYDSFTKKWIWDYIGDDMLRNPNAKVRFKLMSNCNRTCIAKACARMVINKTKRIGVI